MLDKLSVLIAGGLTGTALVAFLGTIVRAVPALGDWAFLLVGAIAVACGALLATKNPQVVFSIGIVLFFSTLGAILAII
ncbi:MAG TPA: hypothetical protein V6D26_13040 [Stenomitos sp.]